LASIALQRYDAVRISINGFLAEAPWATSLELFNERFPQANDLPDIRKADLIIWSHVGLLNARAKGRAPS
jgi:hypothetical protein